MNKKIVILVPVIAVIAAVLLAIVLILPSLRAPSPASIEAYVTLNISQLSTVSATMGGEFHVTSIQAENGTGVVEYEDGHNAYTADFTYQDEGKPAIHVTSFNVRQ